ncbi:hypothetical protein CVT25_011642 [Psilocybe cyanescens]|uniref:Pyridoxamine kinase/Phosphomethylpyrimidine kinase domain-containing protein n=1 Tax=Psilocybe cyanescens TaxID=93625 RepID=A0A409WIN5_PSICY|nr:hypothetical protein CVT25_011642 [Psilocybe cyanescens]
MSNVVLTIAGSDSSGGAGIQADLKAFAAHGCYGASVITALTAQNTTGVQGVHPTPSQFVEQQITSVFDDLDIRAIKTGMLFDAAIAKVVVQSLKTRASHGPLPPVICDPVCVSTSGHTLLNEDALDVLISELFPLSTLITPNKSEAELLLSRMGTNVKINDLDAMLASAKKLLSVGCEAVLIKGGHIITHIQDVIATQSKYPELKVIKQGLLGDNMEILLVNYPDIAINSLELVADVLYHKSGETTMFVRPHIESSSTHGTGCTLSSAIASELANGSSLDVAVANAAMYTHVGIQTAHPIGKGHGPLNHFHNVTKFLIPQRTATNPYPFTRLLIEGASSSWKGYVEHDFVRQLGQGTLDRARFIHFIKQDYLYLKYYARAYGLLAAKSTSFGWIRSATETILNVLHEIGNHKTYCSTFGITEADLENTPESAATTSYGAYMIDIGLQGDSMKLVMALTACLLGYGEVGLWLKKQASMENSWVVLEGNPYKHWIEEYAGKMYQDAVRIGLETIESFAVADPPSAQRLNEWHSVWERCTRLEKGFWDMAMQLSE